MAAVRAGGSARHDFEPTIFYVFICTGNCSRTEDHGIWRFSYYWIADRQGRSFKRLNELFAATGQVGFLASQRVDGKLILPEAVKTMKLKETR